MRLPLLTLCLAAAAHALPGGAFDPDAFTAGEPIIVHNLAIVPLSTTRPEPYDDYTVLEEATTEKKVVIREMPNGGQVSQLTVKNTGAVPLYLLGGEVLLGGQQDRMLQTDVVVDPGKAANVEVRCVEHGRWQGSDLTFRDSGSVAHPDLRKAALIGDQSAVWNEVARKSQATGVASTTGTYQRVLQDAPTRQRIKGYVDQLAAGVPASGKVVGFAVAINGDVELVDLFDSPKVVAKLQRKLLASYVLSALERQPLPPEQVRAKAKGINAKSVKEFIGNTDDAKAPSTGTYDNDSGLSTGKIYKKSGKTVHGTFFSKPPSPTAPAKK